MEDQYDIYNLDDDAPYTPPPRHWTYYLAMVVIIPVKAITPLSWLIAIGQAWRHFFSFRSSPAVSVWERALTFWAIIEILFSIYNTIIVAILSSRAHNVAQADLDILRKQFSHILHLHTDTTSGKPIVSPEPFLSPLSYPPPSGVLGHATKLEEEDIPFLERADPRAIDFRNSLRTWFNKHPWSSISRKSMRSWLGWSMFTAHYETLSEGQKVHIESIIKMIEKRAGAEISEHPPHGTPHLTPLRISLDPLNVENRPAIVYAVVNLAGFGALRWYEWRHGVQYGTIGGLDYLIRIPSGPLDMPRGDEDRTPILFLHGVGVGLVQHLVFINNILSDTTLANRIVLIPIQPHISQTIFHPNHIHPPRKDEILRDLRLLIYMACSIAGFENRPQVTVLSHSNGTSLHAWLLKSNPELIFRSCFVDPVIFCLWEGDVCYNFVYKAPSNGVEALSKYFVASEMGIANYIQRNWDWSANTLFFQEIPHPHDAYRTRIFLSGRDQIVSAKRVRRYFAFHGLTDVDSKTVFVHEGATHAEAMFLGGAGLRFIVNWLKATGIGSLSGMEDFQDEKVGRSTYPVRLDDERQYS